MLRTDHLPRQEGRHPRWTPPRAFELSLSTALEWWSRTLVSAATELSTCEEEFNVMQHIVVQYLCCQVLQLS